MPGKFNSLIEARKYAPGPGSYDYKDQSRIYPSIKFGTEPRKMFESRNQSPGPGTYKLKPTFADVPHYLLPLKWYLLYNKITKMDRHVNYSFVLLVETRNKELLSEWESTRLVWQCCWRRWGITKEMLQPNGFCNLVFLIIVAKTIRRGVSKEVPEIIRTLREKGTRRTGYALPSNKKREKIREARIQ